MKIGPKSIGPFTIVALICGIVGGVGWYFQSVFNFAPAFAVGRYASFKSQGNQWIGQVSLGAGDANSNILQLVAGF